MTSAEKLIRAILTSKNVSHHFIDLTHILGDDVYICLDQVIGDPSEKEHRSPVINISNKFHTKEQSHYCNGSCDVWTAYITISEFKKEHVPPKEFISSLGELNKEELEEVYGPETIESQLVVNYIQMISL